MDSKMRERFQHRLSPQLFSSDEGPETENDSDEDIIHSYLPQDNHDLLRAFDGVPGSGLAGPAGPAVNITIHPPGAGHVLESEICQLADIQESIQRMREGELGGAGEPEARLSSSCPSLALESGAEDTPTPRRRARQQHYSKAPRAGGHRKARGGRQRSPSESTGESEDEEGTPRGGEGRGAGHYHGARPCAAAQPAGAGEPGLAPLHKSVSTPSMAQGEVAPRGTGGKAGRRQRMPEPTHVFIQKLIAEHGWSHQRSCTDSETEGEADIQPGAARQDPPVREQHARPTVTARLGPPAPPGPGLPSPQLTLAQFLQDPALSEEERGKRRRNKKERGGSLFSLRKKKDKKEGAKGLAKAGSAVSLQSRVVTAPRVPQHSYSMSSLKRYPGVAPGQGPPPANSQFYLARSESSKSTEDREEVDGDRENLLDSELPPGEDFPEGFPLSVRHLDTDPFLRIQKEEPETWSASVPDGIAAALKTHEAKRQEHIYEFIITEKHHCQLLRVIQRVFCEGMTQHLDMKPEILERLFPQLDTLIEMHFEFLRQLRERQDQTAVIPTIADILLTQFQEEQAVRWRSAYGAFCSQHLDAVSIYKEQLKSDRRFHEFVQQCSNNPLLRKMGIPECILTVTTRITKYPLLIEPLIKTAKDRPAEQQKLRSCLALVKNILVDVNGQVAEKERAQRLLEIYNRMDARSSVTHEGRKFKKSDILLEGRKLLFEGLCTLVSPALAPGPGGRGNRSPGPVLVIVVVLTDVVLFLQENNQKYTFVTPEGKAGALPVHSLIAREKQGVDSPKSLYLLSTTEDNTVPGMLELGVVQPRDRQDWIGGIRRAVDLSSGGSAIEDKLESEAETARKELESKYMRMRQLTSELRGRDLDLARLLEDKMRLLGEMLEELGAEGPPPASYLPLVQERREGELPGGREQALAQVQEAVKLASSLYSSCGPLGRSASSVGEHQSPGFESPGLPRRAETFGGFDTGREGGEVRGERRGRDGLPGPPLAGLDPAQAAAAVQLTHHLNTVMCMVSEHFTSLEGFKVELAECRERAALGWGRYKHNQQLEELRQAQEQLVAERRSWARHREEQERELAEKLDGMARGQTQLEQEKKDIEQQRNKLFRKLEALRDQGFEFGTNMTVIGPGHLAAQQAEPQGFVMEVRKAVSPGGGGEARKPTVSSVPHPGDRKPSTLPPPPPGSKKASESKNHHLLSATNESKGDLHEVKQQIPLALAKLSMGGPKSKEKNRSCSKIDKPSISAPIMPAMMASSGQMLPFKLSESDRKASGQLPSPKAGYQKLSSNSFAEDRVGRAAGREEGAAHARTGSSPASMSGRPMSNTLPKSAGRGPSPPEQRPQAEIQKVNYANSGEEVFYF